jgi:phospholipid-binding lipoprotein MlaA
MKMFTPLPFAIEKIARYVAWAGAALVFAVMTGCATGPNANRADPFEPMNRGVARFNDSVDNAVLRPTATAYRNAVPSMIRTGVTNFFGNLRDVWSLANNILQLKVQNSAETFMRLNVNTFFGLGGVLDVAGELGIERHREDFGQTLGYYGIPAGPYIVLPLLGPSTLRDTAALPLDRYADGLGTVQDIPWRNSLSVLNVVDTRANLLRASQMLEDAALDKYSFTRDAFLQLRLNDVHDGNPPGDGGQ